jgi:predicted nucleic acid-binding protein
MGFLVDTNIFLDVVLWRRGLFEESQATLNWFSRHSGEGWIAWHTLANLYYVGTRTAGAPRTKAAIAGILEVFEVCPVGSREAREAGRLDLPDFEDALQVSAGLSAGVELIITRNGRDFRRSPLPAILPKEFLDRVVKGR